MGRSRLVVAAAVFSLLFVIGELVFIPKTAVNSAFTRALVAPRIFLSALYNKHKLITQLQDLTLENQALRGQIEEARALPHIIEEGRRQYLRAVVYSSFPLSGVKELTIGVGSAEGVAVGQAVMLKPGLFIGEVSRTTAHQSIVRTIFEAAQTGEATPWQLAVKVGSVGTDALLVADAEPKLTIISRKKGVTVGDTVVLAGKQYPYGVSVGSVGSVIDNPSNVFLEAKLSVPYAITDIDEVFVLVPGV
jgi:cell shape-determining protein MreC